MRTLAVMLMLVPLAATAAELKEGKDWRYCSQDAQCVLIEGTCAKTAVNQLSKNAASAYYAQKVGTVDCVEPFWKPRDKEVVARCRLGGCETILKQPASAASK